jgi:hypothetical protein
MQPNLNYESYGDDAFSQTYLIPAEKHTIYNFFRLAVWFLLTVLQVYKRVFNMDHDQQLVQLRDFDQQVLSQPDNAQLFATKGFLETLSTLIQYGCDKEDDGTDAYKEELKTLKSATRAFSTILPIVFKTV